MDSKLISKEALMEIYAISVDEGRKKKFSFGIIIGQYPSKIINCRSCGRAWKKDLLLEHDISIKILLSNENYPDFLGVMHHVLVSKVAMEVINNENLTGYVLKRIKPMSVNDLLSDEKKILRQEGYKVNNFSSNPPIYFRMFIDEGAMLHSESNVHLIEKCIDCGFQSYATVGENYVDPFQPIIIDKSSWNGQDLFLIKELGARIFCTEKFVEIYEKYKLSGLVFEKVEIK